MREKKSFKEQLQQCRQQCRAVFKRLKEQDRRHVPGLLALLVGHGGIEWVADAVGLQRSCVSRGKAEVKNGLQGCPIDRQRLPGGGRKPIEKKVLKSSRISKKSSPKKSEGLPQENVNSSD